MKKHLTNLERFNLYKFIEENKEKIESGEITSTMIQEQFNLRSKFPIHDAFKVLGIKDKKVVVRVALKKNDIKQIHKWIRSLAIAINEMSDDCGSKPFQSVLNIINETYYLIEDGN